MEGLTVVGDLKTASLWAAVGLIHFPEARGKSLFARSKVADFSNFARSRIRKIPYYIRVLPASGRKTQRGYVRAPGCKTQRTYVTGLTLGPDFGT